jgi:aminomethyltransferase
VPEDEDAPPGAVYLAELHRSLGGRLEETALGVELPADYGSPEDEYQALRLSCGVADRSWSDTLELIGEDRVRFLNGMVTCDVAAPGAGEGTYGFFTDAKGKVLADVAVLVSDDRLLLELPPGSGEPIARHLQKYIITDRVEIRELDDQAFAISGPTAGLCLDRLAAGEVPREDWRHGRRHLFGCDVDICSHPRLGAPGFVVRVARADSEALFSALAGHQEGSEFAPVGHRAMEQVRVEGGFAIPGIDLDPRALPQETGWIDAVSYTKGCYLGQEIVARVHYRGQVNRHLRGLCFESTEPPEPGAAVGYEGETVGFVTSPVMSPELGQPIGLSMIHRKAFEPTTWVEVEGVGEAEVTELPFVHIHIA